MRLIDADIFKQQIAALTISENPAFPSIVRVRALLNLIDKQPTVCEVGRIYKNDAITAINKEIQKQKNICGDILDTPGWWIYEKAMEAAKDAIRALPERKEK